MGLTKDAYENILDNLSFGRGPRKTLYLIIGSKENVLCTISIYEFSISIICIKDSPALNQMLAVLN
jgi:hypothetical protein